MRVKGKRKKREREKSYDIGLVCVGPSFFSFLGWKHNWVIGAKWAEWDISLLLGDRKWVIEWWVMGGENWVISDEWPFLLNQIAP